MIYKYTCTKNRLRVDEYVLHNISCIHLVQILFFPVTVSHTWMHRCYYFYKFFVLTNRAVSIIKGLGTQSSQPLLCQLMITASMVSCRLALVETMAGESRNEDLTFNVDTVSLLHWVIRL